MEINLIQIVVIIVIAGLCWYVNEALNRVPTLKQVVSVLIVVISVLMLLQSLGIFGTSTHIRIN